MDKQCKPWAEYKKAKKAQVSSVAAIASIAADIMATPAEDLIPQICREAGISEADIMFVYAGVPCETYSPAGWTNYGRDLDKTAHGYNYRINDEERNPCCDEDMACKYGDKARLHDSLVKHVIASFKASYKRGNKYHFGVENPDGELKRRPFMQKENWPKELPYAYKPFHCCAFKHPAKKPMSYWTSLEQYTPKGTTGNGMCNEGQCGMGSYNSDTGRFNHDVKIAREPKDGFRGPGATAMKNAMPDMWMQEFMQEAAKNTSKSVVIDLCAGWQGLRPVCEALGLDYIAVDIEGDRNIRAALRPHIVKMG